MMAVVLLVVIGVSVAATLYVTGRQGGRGATALTTGTPSDYASANDTGPVSIITDEPTCGAFLAINDTLAKAEANGWSVERSSYGSPSQWTPNQREHLDAVVEAINMTERQMLALARITPHRVIREMFEQFVAFGREYLSSLSHYTPRNDTLADTFVNLGNALLGVCNSISLGSAFRVSGPKISPPSVTAVAVGGETRRFITVENRVCREWVERERDFVVENMAWTTLDAEIPAAQWTHEQRVIQLAALPLLKHLANDMEQNGRRSEEPTFADLAGLGSVYLRAYVSTGQGYVGSDSWLSYAGLRVNNAIAAACRSAGA